MNNVTNSFSVALSNFFSFLPSLLAAVLLFFVAWLVASLVKKLSEKGLKAAGLGGLLIKWGVADSDEQAAETLQSFSKVLYYLVWVLFLPGILDLLGLTSISQPISAMFHSVFAFLPQLLAAVFLLAAGLFVARFVKNLVYNFLLAVNIDKWVDKVTKTTSDSSQEQKVTLAKVGATIVYVAILVPIITIALETLQIHSISEPIIGVLQTILGALPNIIVAIILLAVGLLLASFAGDLLTQLLRGTGVNKLTKYLKNAEGKIDLAAILGQTVEVLIVIFFVVEALNSLNLTVLNTIGAAVIAYLPLAISAVLILGAGFIGGSLLETYISKTTSSTLSGKIVNYVLIVFSVFMALEQLQFATDIVRLAFLLILAGLSVAFALAFGIGGRDFAKHQLEKLEKKADQDMTSQDQSGPDDNFTV